MPSPTFEIPAGGAAIRMEQGVLRVPATPIIPYIEGDGSGPDIWRAARPVLDAAVEKAYAGQRKIAWMEVFAGQKSKDLFDTWLPEETLKAFETYLVGIKGPLTTPVGGGMRSLNVALRKTLDLYVCQRPVRWFQGVPSPVRHPEFVDMVIFRENTEDLYAGIEFAAETQDNLDFQALFRQRFPQEFARIRFPETTSIGLKPISRQGTQRLVRAAIRWALRHQRRSVTITHKGNIMKFTEGGFRTWGYDLAETEFAGQVFTYRQWDQVKEAFGEAAANAALEAALSAGKLIVKDVITDALFEQTITRARDFDVIAATNLNGDYLSDALAAQVGGIGIAPGGNLNDETGVAVFEATHGTAPRLAGLNKANPSSVILSGEMLLRYLGWTEAADLVVRGIERAIAAHTLTFDLYDLVEEPEKTLCSTSEFGQAVIAQMSA